MNDLFQRAIEATEASRADGRITPKEALFVTSCYCEWVFHSLAMLLDPFHPVDREQLTSDLIAGWGRVETVLDGVSMPFAAQWALRFVRAQIVDVLPDVSNELAKILDAGE